MQDNGYYLALVASVKPLGGESGKPNDDDGQPSTTPILSSSRNRERPFFTDRRFSRRSDITL
jgi:hypothetical protein